MKPLSFTLEVDGCLATSREVYIFPHAGFWTGYAHLLSMSGSRPSRLAFEECHPGICNH